MNPMSMLTRLRSGCMSSLEFTRHFNSFQYSNLSPSNRFEFDRNQHTASITSLDLDKDENRYLLVGLGDGTLCIHDTVDCDIRAGLYARSNVIFRVGRASKHCHSHSIQTVSWYTEDSGLFLTSGRDGLLKMWDANEGKPADQYKVGAAVNSHAVGPEALVAVANESNHLTLVDMKTGSSSHMLRGHSSQVICLAWSPAHTTILASGGDDGKVIIWDVRQSKSYLSYLDYNNVKTRKGKPPPKAAGQSHQVGVLGLTYCTTGNYILSLGKDNRLRKWDALSYKNTKTKFPDVEVSVKKARSRPKGGGRCSVDLVCSRHSGADMIYLPENSNIAVMDMNTGVKSMSLIAHFSLVSALTMAENEAFLFSGGRDQHILRWDSDLYKSGIYAYLEDQNELREEACGEDRKAQKSSDQPNAINQHTVDTWSSDDEEL